MAYNFRGRARNRAAPFRGRGRGRGRGFDRGTDLVITLKNRGQGQDQGSWVPQEESDQDGASSKTKISEEHDNGDGKEYPTGNKRVKTVDDNEDDRSSSRRSRDKFDLKTDAESLRITVGNERVKKDLRNAPLSDRLGPPVIERKDAYRERKMDDHHHAETERWERRDDQGHHDRDRKRRSRSHERESDRGLDDGRHRQNEWRVGHQGDNRHSRVDRRDDRSNRRNDDCREDFRRDCRDDFRDDKRDDFRGDNRDEYRSDRRDDYRGERRDDYRSDHRDGRDGRKEHRDRPRSDGRGDIRGEPWGRGRPAEDGGQVGGNLQRGREFSSDREPPRADQQSTLDRRDDPFDDRTGHDRSMNMRNDRDSERCRIPSTDWSARLPSEAPTPFPTDGYRFPGERSPISIGPSEGLHEPPTVMPPAPKPLKSILKRKIEPTLEESTSNQSITDFNKPRTSSSYESQVEDFLKKLQLPVSRAPPSTAPPTFPIIPGAVSKNPEFNQIPLKAAGFARSESSHVSSNLPGFEQFDHGHTSSKIPGLGHSSMDVDDEEQFLYGDSGSGGIPPKEGLFPINRDPSKPAAMPMTSPQARLSEDKSPSAAPSSSLPSWMNPTQPEPQVPVEEPKGDDIDKTIQNVLKSIGFNFDLSKRMQELAKVKKKKEEDSQFPINQNASFLGGGIVGAGIKEKLFQKEKRLEMKELIMQSAKSFTSKESTSMQFMNREPPSQPPVHSRERSREKSTHDFRDYSRPADSRDHSGRTDCGDRSFDSGEHSPYDSRGSDGHRLQMSVPVHDSHAKLDRPNAPGFYSRLSQQQHSGNREQGDDYDLHQHSHRHFSPDDLMRKPTRPSSGINLPSVPTLHDENQKINSQPAKRGREKSPEYSRIVLAPKSKKRESSPTAKVTKLSDHSRGRSFKNPMSDLKISVSADKKEVFVEERWNEVSSRKEQVSSRKEQAETDRWKAVPVKQREKGSPQRWPQDGDIPAKAEKEAPVSKVTSVQLTAAEKQTMIKESDERNRKLQLLERELGKLKKHQNEIMRKRRRQRDGHKDPLLMQNSKLQEEISAQIKILRKVSDESDLALKQIGIKPSTISRSPVLEAPLLVREEPDKPVVLTRRHEFYDPGSHWCGNCNQVSLSLFDHLTHLQSKKHKAKCNPYERPWLDELLKNDTPVDETLPANLQAMKGVEFIMSTDAFYCTLCNVFTGDVTCAEKHLKSEKHFANYQNHLKQNEFYEKRYTLEKTAFLSQVKEEEHEQKKKSTIDKRLASQKNVPTSAREVSPSRKNNRNKDIVESDKEEKSFKDSSRSRPEKDEETSRNTRRRDSTKREDEDDSSLDDASKGKIAIKLTGRTGIKPPPKSLPPWTPLTKSRDTSVHDAVKTKPNSDVQKKVATITKHDIDQPSSLGKFLSIGGLTTKKLPVYKLRPGAVKKPAVKTAKTKIDADIEYQDMKWLAAEQDTSPIGPKIPPPPPPEPREAPISLDDIPIPPTPPQLDDIPMPPPPPEPQQATSKNESSPEAKEIPEIADNESTSSSTSSIRSLWKSSSTSSVQTESPPSSANSDTDTEAFDGLHLSCTATFVEDSSQDGVCIVKNEATPTDGQSDEQLTAKTFELNVVVDPEPAAKESSIVEMESNPLQEDDTNVDESVDGTAEKANEDNLGAGETESVHEEMKDSSMEKQNANEEVMGMVVKEYFNEEIEDAVLEKKLIQEVLAEAVEKENVDEEILDEHGENVHVSKEMVDSVEKENVSDAIEESTAESEAIDRDLPLCTVDTRVADDDCDRQMENSPPMDAISNVAEQEDEISEDMDTSSTEKEMQQEDMCEIQTNDDINPCGNLDVVLSNVFEDSVDKNADVVAFDRIDMLMPPASDLTESSIGAMSEIDDLSGNISFMMGEIISLEGEENANAAADCTLDFSGGNSPAEPSNAALGHTDATGDGSVISMTDFPAEDEISGNH